LNPFILGNISSTRPEWFQANLFVISLCLAVLGYYAIGFWKKMVWYVLTALCFTLGFFSKFNLLPLSMVFVAFLIADSSGVRSKALYLAGAIAVSLSFYIGYVALFHQPSTGTRTLTYDKSWILMRKAGMAFPREVRDAADGIHLNRFKMLTWLLKKREGWIPMHPPNLYANIDAVPPEKRRPFRERYGYLLQANEAELERLFEKYPAARTSWGNQLLISYYIGLKESDTLGTRAFLELVRSEPLIYLQDVWGRVKRSVFKVKTNNYPLYVDYGWYQLQRPYAFSKERHIPKRLALGYAEVDLSKSRSIGYRKPLLWLPGVAFFSALTHIFRYWVQLAVIAMAVVIAAALIQRVKAKRWQVSTVGPMVMGAIVVFFVVWSCFVYRFRATKELILCMPFLSVFLGLLVGLVMGKGPGGGGPSSPPAS
jgi:hypothetical protein